MQGNTAPHYAVANGNFPVAIDSSLDCVAAENLKVIMVCTRSIAVVVSL